MNRDTAAHRIARGRARRLERQRQASIRQERSRLLAPLGRILTGLALAAGGVVALAVAILIAEHGSQALCSAGTQAACPLARFLAAERLELQRQSAAERAERERAASQAPPAGGRITAKERVLCRSRLGQLTGMPGEIRILTSPEQQQQSGVITYALPDGRGGEEVSAFDCRAGS